MHYDKKIKYLDYYVDGARVSGAGFVRIELRDAVCRLDINVKIARSTINATGRIIMLGSYNRAVQGELLIENGVGQYRREYLVDSCLGDTNIEYDDLTGIWILLDKQREIKCCFDKEEVREENRTELQAAMSPVLSGELEAKEDVSMKEAAVAKDFVQTKGNMNSNEFMENLGMGNVEKDEMRSREQVQTKRKLQVTVLPDEKWRQLTAIYPKLKPFRDEREYLSITPSDFVILTENSYRKANNSFLLHGYYNYHHLILTHVKKYGEDIYYLGVPGNYYDREKQVAIMFGFESFECAEEPSQIGDFGYYMMRVML